MPALNLLTPVDYDSSTCGYCSPPGKRSEGKTSYSYGNVTCRLMLQFYQDLIDRGWRRSGMYTYHPDMGRTCCPQYTIRLHAAEFKPSRHQRSAVNRWNRFLSTGLKPGEQGDDEMAGKQPGEAKKGKGKGKAKPFDLVAELRAHQVGYGYDSATAKHRFELEFTPATPTPETYALYKRYQMSVHKDPEHKASMSGFTRFLCESPLSDDDIAYAEGTDTTHLPKHYGSYHLLYRVDGEIVGISVIDVLPSCVSSVYFIWDPDWAWAGLGKLSALYEIALVRDMAAAGAPGMEWLYMGFWIGTCQKMRYKGEYSPSYILDPGTQEFHLLTPKLDKYITAKKNGYTPLADIEAISDADLEAIVGTAPAPKVPGDDVSMKSVKVHDTPATAGTEPEAEWESESESDESAGSAEWPSPPPPGFLDPNAIDDDVLDNLLVFNISQGRPTLVPYLVFRGHLNPWARVSVQELVAALGPDMLASGERGDYKTRGLLFFH